MRMRKEHSLVNEGRYGLNRLLDKKVIRKVILNDTDNILIEWEKVREKKREKQR